MEVDLVLSRLTTKRTLRIADVGSHFGEMLEILQLHPDRHFCDVVAVEPEASNLRMLKARVPTLCRLRVRVCPVAISDVSERRPFFTASETTLFTCTPEWKAAFPDAFARSKDVEVECLTFSDLMRVFSIPATPAFDFAKIDTEGHDLNVLRSLLTSPAVFNSVMFEIGLDDVLTGTACELLQSSGLSEMYVFARVGPATTYVGEWRSVEHLSGLRAEGRLDSGNIVAFRV